MKQYQAPQLHLVEMPMAESIANTCCYTEIVNGLTTTKKVLSGGTIGPYTWYNVYPDVVRYLGGIATAPRNHYKYYYTVDDGPAGYSEGAAWITGGQRTLSKDVLMFTQNGDHTLARLVTITNGEAYEEDPNTGYVALSYSGCDHMSRKCPFNEQLTVDLIHSGAKYPHAMGGSLWASPHQAIMYNS